MNKNILILMIGLVLLSGCINIAEKFSQMTNTQVKETYVVSNAGVKYELKILEEFENNEWVRVIIRLKDNSGIIVTGTKEEKISLLKEKEKWYALVIDDILSTLSKDEFDLTRESYYGFNGEITKEGFDKLVNNEKVEGIYQNVMVSENT